MSTGRRPFRVAKFISEASDVLSGAYKTSEAIVTGSVLLIDSNGELTVAGVDPAVIDGISLEPAASKPGWDAANSPTVITGRVQEVSYSIANRVTTYSGRLEDGSGNLVTIAQTHKDEEYGVTKDSGDNTWYVNTAKTGADARVRIIDVDVDRQLILFKFLEANISSN